LAFPLSLVSFPPPGRAAASQGELLHPCGCSPPAIRGLPSPG
jgi:hypothetical protein